MFASLNVRRIGVLSASDDDQDAGARAVWFAGGERALQVGSILIGLVDFIPVSQGCQAVALAHPYFHVVRERPRVLIQAPDRKRHDAQYESDDSPA